MSLCHLPRTASLVQEQQAAKQQTSRALLAANCCSIAVASLVLNRAVTPLPTVKSSLPPVQDFILVFFPIVHVACLIGLKDFVSSGLKGLVLMSFSNHSISDFIQSGIDMREKALLRQKGLEKRPVSCRHGN